MIFFGGFVWKQNDGAIEVNMLLLTFLSETNLQKEKEMEMKIKMIFW